MERAARRGRRVGAEDGWKTRRDGAGKGCLRWMWRGRRRKETGFGAQKAGNSWGFMSQKKNDEEVKQIMQGGKGLGRSLARL